MQSPVPTILMVLAYLYTVVILGPRLMANRKPFKLKEVLVIYNGFQVLFSLYMLYEVSHSSNHSNHFFLDLDIIDSFKINITLITDSDRINHGSWSALAIRQGYIGCVAQPALCVNSLHNIVKVV